MRKRVYKYFSPLLFIFFIVSCATITVNIYFPSEAVEQAAEKILNEIETVDSDADGDTLDAIDGVVDELESYISPDFKSFFLGSSVVYADEINLNLTTPAIRKVIKTMKRRNIQIRRFKSSGAIGETFKGHLEIRDLNGLGGGEIRTIKGLLNAENTDRDSLYKELAKANKIDVAEVTKISKIFAKKRRDRRGKGEWYKDEDGKWRQLE